MTSRQIARLKAENSALRAELGRLARMVAAISRAALDGQGTVRLDRRRVNSARKATGKTRRALRGRKQTR